MCESAAGVVAVGVSYWGEKQKGDAFKFHGSRKNNHIAVTLGGILCDLSHRTDCL